METVGFSPDDIVNIFRVVAAVLKLGNLIFDPVNNIDGTEGCCINNEYGKPFYKDNCSKVVSVWNS